MIRMVKLILFALSFIPLSATADIAVIVNIDNPTEIVSYADIKNIYRVRMSLFSDGGPIILSYQPASLEITQRFFDLAVGRSMTQLNRFWATRIFAGRMRRPVKLVGDQQVIQWISQNRSGIGYIDELNLTDKVKKVATIRF